MSSLFQKTNLKLLGISFGLIVFFAFLVLLQIPLIQFSATKDFSYLYAYRLYYSGNLDISSYVPEAYQMVVTSNGKFPQINDIGAFVLYFPLMIIFAALW